MSRQTPNAFLRQVEDALPRILGSLNLNPISPFYGLMDREYWSWKTSDFANASPQSVVAGITQLWQAGLWPYPSVTDRMPEMVNALVRGVQSITRPDGSLEEAAPREGSWCVTALVGFDLMCAYEYSDGLLQECDREQILQVVNPLAVYVMRNRETHAYIANHIATGVAFLERWGTVTDDSAALSEANSLLSGLIESQDLEGWFPEYGGADPGYQTLTMYYLTDCFSRQPRVELGETIEKSLKFLSHFVHPDGSFGGTYGSRNTRFYYPSGIAELAPQFPTAAAIHKRMTQSIHEKAVVGLDSMDKGNIGPMFNSYCRTAVKEHQLRDLEAFEVLPSEKGDQLRLQFPRAGLVIDGGLNHYTIVSVGKGGVVYHFQGDQLIHRDDGVAVLIGKGLWATTQYLEEVQELHDSEQDELVITKRLAAVKGRKPSVSTFIALRILSLTAFRSELMRKWIKAKTIKSLNARQIKEDVTNVRTIRFGFDLVVIDTLRQSAGIQIVPSGQSFSPLHMASQGYWEFNDETTLPRGDS